MTVLTLIQAVKKQDLKQIRILYNNSNVIDFIDNFKQLNTHQQLIAIRLLDSIAVTEIINRLEKLELTNLIHAFTKPEMKQLLSKLYADDIVDLIDDLPHDLVRKILLFITPEQRKDVNYILKYSEDHIGSEMSVNFIALNIEWTVEQAIQNIKIHNIFGEENLYYYVVDKKGFLIGNVDTNQLLAAPHNHHVLISSILETNVVSLRTTMSTEDAVAKMQRYELTEAPVVDRYNKLIGVINRNDALELFEEARIDDINKFAGIIEEPDAEYFSTGVIKMFWARFPWLAATILITAFTQIVLGFLMQKIDSTRTEYAFISFIIPFIPFILTIVGNIALQSTAIVVKNIILKVIDRKRYLATLMKELQVACLILVAVLLLNLPRSFLVQWILVGQNAFNSEYWMRFGIVNLVLVISIILTILFSTLLPILAHRFGVDPSLMSSPLLTTIVDLVVTSVAVGITFAFFALK